MTHPDPATVVAYDPGWAELFDQLGRALRGAFGGIALRIDHIGSTAVRGLDAKPIIDIQISVASLEPISRFRGPLEQAGFVWCADNLDRTKAYFRERPGDRRTHVHVRRGGSFSEQFALLFRNFLRAHPERRASYAELKHGLAHLLREDREAYGDAKTPSSGRRFALPTSGPSARAGNRAYPTPDVPRQGPNPAGRFGIGSIWR